MKNLRHKHLINLHQSGEDKAITLEELRSTISQNPIEDDQIYTGVTNAFLLNGGDDFSQVIKRPDQIHLIDKTLYPISMKNLIQMQLEQMKDLDEDDLAGPNNMERLIIQEGISKQV